jgi:hypothetical protein
MGVAPTLYIVVKGMKYRVFARKEVLMEGELLRACTTSSDRELLRRHIQVQLGMHGTVDDLRLVAWTVLGAA